MFATRGRSPYSSRSPQNIYDIVVHLLVSHLERVGHRVEAHQRPGQRGTLSLRGQLDSLLCCRCGGVAVAPRVGAVALSRVAARLVLRPPFCKTRSPVDLNTTNGSHT